MHLVNVPLRRGSETGALVDILLDPKSTSLHLAMFELAGWRPGLQALVVVSNYGWSIRPSFRGNVATGGHLI
jgi:hypothetical protein